MTTVSFNRPITTHIIAHIINYWVFGIHFRLKMRLREQEHPNRLLPKIGLPQLKINFCCGWVFFKILFYWSHRPFQIMLPVNDKDVFRIENGGWQVKKHVKFAVCVITVDGLVSTGFRSGTCRIALVLLNDLILSTVLLYLVSSTEELPYGCMIDDDVSMITKLCRIIYLEISSPKSQK